MNSTDAVGQSTANLTDAEFTMLKRLVEKRDRNAAHATVASVDTAQYRSPRSLTPEIPTDLCVHMEKRVFQRLGVGGDTTIPSPGRSPKQPLPGIGLHDSLHGRQACLEFNSFHQGVGQVSPRKGLFSCRPLPKRGQICDIPALPNR